MWEYKKQILKWPDYYYEKDMLLHGWVWQGNTMTKDGMLWLWKRRKKKENIV